MYSRKTRTRMQWIVYLVTLLLLSSHVAPKIRSGAMMNKLGKVRPVGAAVGKKFVPLTELPPLHAPHAHPHIHPHTHPHSGRRHLPDECTQGPVVKEVIEGKQVDIIGDYYDDRMAKTVATVIIPDHIDHKHFQVTTQVPYLTLGPIEAIGYHPSTMKSEHPSECEKIYQDHMAELYSDETTDYSEESLEMAKMPVAPVADVAASFEDHLVDMYDMD